MNRAQQVTLIGAFGLVIGALLPWVSMSSPLLSVSMEFKGYEGDGILSGGIGVIVLLIALLYKGKPGKMYSWPLSLIAILAGIIVINVFGNMQEAISEVTTDINASLGPGIYLSLLGALLAVVGGFIKLPEEPQPETTTAEPAS